MIPLIIGAAMTAASGIANAVKNHSIQNKQKKLRLEQEKDIENDYNDSKGDPTQNAYTQRAITAASDNTKNLAGAVNSAVNENPVARAQVLQEGAKQNAQILSDAVVQGQQQQQQAKQNYENRKDQLYYNGKVQDLQNEATNANNALNTFSQIGGALIQSDINSSQNGSNNTKSFGVSMSDLKNHGVANITDSVNMGLRNQLDSLYGKTGPYFIPTSLYLKK